MTKQGDRIRLIEAFESAGVPLDALVAGAATGRIDWTGDGALMLLPEARVAVDACLDLMALLGPAGLPGGHAGVHCGPLLERDGDIFGRTVNAAARISDVAPDGAIYATADVISQLPGAAYDVEPIGEIALQGIGEVEVWSVTRAG